MSQNPSTQEEQERAALLDVIRNNKLEAFEYMASLSRVPPETMKHFGHATLGEALINVLNETMKKNERAIVAHERKFPD